MKLLYATSITLPSRHANRRQILSMAQAFYALLGADFLLGMSAIRDGSDTGVPTVLMGEGKRSIFLAWKYVQLIRTRGITHVYTREDRLFFFLKCYARLLRLPARIFFEAHTLEQGFFFRYAVLHADRVVALTGGLRDDLAAMGVSQPILVAHDGVDIERFTTEISKTEARRQFNIPQEAVVVAYIGRYRTNHQEDKGVGELIRAFGKARTLLPLHLLIVGLAPRDVAPVERLCEESGITADARTLVQYVPQSDVARAMRAADILVMNYPNLRHYALYMSPMKLFEYMASQTPFITTDLPSVREVLSDDEAFFVPPGAPDALSSMLVHSAQNKEEGAHKAAAAFEKVKGYTWNLRASSIVHFITGV